MNIIGIVRIGRDAETRQAGGQSVTSFTASFDVGRKAAGEDFAPSQWIELAMWGDRGAKIAQYLTKGKKVMIVASDPTVKEFTKNDLTTATKLTARLDNVEFVGGDKRDDEPQRSPAPAPRQPAPRPPAPKPKPSTGFDDMDSDIPFN